MVNFLEQQTEEPDKFHREFMGKLSQTLKKDPEKYSASALKIIEYISEPTNRLEIKQLLENHPMLKNDPLLKELTESASIAEITSFYHTKFKDFLNN